MEAFADYLNKVENLDNRARVAEVLEWVHAAFPELATRVAWNQPMFTDHGTFIIAFSVAKRHMAVAPERAAMLHFSEDIVKAGYEHSQELIRLSWDRPVDFELLKRIIEFNIVEKADCATFWRSQDGK